MKRLAYSVYNLIPNKLKILFNCRRRRRYWIENGAIFIHVPKVAGTSVSFSLYGRSLGHLKAKEIKRWCPNEFEALFKFGLTRNPWDRIVSAYQFALQGSTNSAGLRKKKQYQSTEFQSFETFIMEWLAYKDLTSTDYVFQPQHLFILDTYNNNLLDYVGKFENINRDIKTVSNILHKELQIPVLNQIGIVRNYREFYSNRQIVNKVGDIYSQDVKHFNYDF